MNESLQGKHKNDDDHTDNVVNMQFKQQMIDSNDEFETTSKELGYFGVFFQLFCNNNNKQISQQQNKNKSKNENKNIDLSSFEISELKYQFDTIAHLFDQCGKMESSTSATYTNFKRKS